MENIIREAIDLQSSNERALLALVLGASGSTPRKAGAAMLITEGGRTYGTIGGGIWMNAGAYGGEMRQVVSEVRVIDKNGDIVTVSGEDAGFL